PEPRSVLWAALLSVLVFSVAAVMPLLTLPLLTLTPFPLSVLRLRASLGNAVLATALAAALVGALLGPGLGLLLAAVAAPGLVLAESMARGRGMRRGTAWSMAFAACELGLALLFAPARMAALALAPWDEVRSTTFVEGLRAAGLPAEQVQWWLDRATTLHGVLAVVFPAFFLIMGAGIALGHALALRLYLRRRDPGWLESGEFESARLPMVLSVVFVACGAAVLAPPLRPLAYNVLLVLGFLYVIQGVAVVSFYARRLAAPPLLRAAVLVLVLVNPWAPQVLALLGLFDLWFDFRKWAEVPE
ncbi:MAG TPA: DUF2232 domain-containing protein, partial [Vicinamibacteria bacterium]|nr:DUF2232 domain-containing protein [Vicinamibacteria bacterium]